MENGPEKMTPNEILLSTTKMPLKASDRESIQREHVLLIWEQSMNPAASPVWTWWSLRPFPALMILMSLGLNAGKWFCLCASILQLYCTEISYTKYKDFTLIKRQRVSVNLIKLITKTTLHNHSKAVNSQFGTLPLVGRFFAGQDFQTFQVAEYVVYSCLNLIFYHCKEIKTGFDLN